VSLVKTSLHPRETRIQTFDSHVINPCTFETTANNFYTVMAAKGFQTRTEEEIEQLQIYMINTPYLLTRQTTMR